MKIPLFTDPQLLDASAPGGLNPAFGAVSGNFASIGKASWAAPGLSAPEAMTLSFSGMVASVGLPSPWGVVSSGGVLVRAHGTQTGQDTQAYTVDFTPLVPGLGYLTAYLAVTITEIQQGPFPVPGPPPGHPAYDPNFVPSVAYAATAYTVALAAVSGGIDNVNTFELMRTTLMAGQVAVSGWSTAGQFRAADRDAWPPVTHGSGGILTATQAQMMHVFASGGVTLTMPPASGAGGLMFGFVNPLSVTGTVATTGSDLILGLGASGSSSLVVPPSGSVTLWGDTTNALAGQWQVVGSSPSVATAQASNTYPVGNSQTATTTNISATTAALTAPANGYALAYGVTSVAPIVANSLTTAVLSASLGGFIGLTADYNGSIDSQWGYLPMAKGQSSTFTLVGTQTNPTLMTASVIAFFVPMP
jgi:hypothetical protein